MLYIAESSIFWCFAKRARVIDKRIVSINEINIIINILVFHFIEGDITFLNKK